MIIKITIVLLWLTKASVLAASLAKDGCEERCGGVVIPYPFGIGTGTNSSCFISQSYSIECRNTADGAPKPFLSSVDLEVLNITLDGYIRVNNPVISWNCPRNGSNGVDSVDLGKGPFVFSETENRFMAVGCNNLALMKDLNDTAIGGCMSLCRSSSSTDSDNSCYGINCCQTTIPPNLQAFKANLTSIEDNPAQYSCTYAFLVDQNWFRYNLSDPFAVANMSHVPAALEWALGNGSTVSVGTNNYCILTNATSNATSSARVSGIRCYCRFGYDGNPYLSYGCQANCSTNSGLYMCGSQGPDVIPSNQKTKMVIIGVCSGVGALLLLLGTWWLYKAMKKRNNMKRRENFFKRNGGLLLQQQLSSNDGSVQKTEVFDSKELEKATDHFNEDRILGQGGQGTVYKGMLSDGRIVAVKKSKIVDEGNVEQFINEVFILSQVVHRNVVKLLGCCLETEVPLLVYEFISNGTLLHYIQDPSEEFPLSWETRLRIAEEVAGALSYLHNGASVPIYHRDIKSTNILLDDKYRAKVSDFGTSRSVAIDQTHLTTLVKGTFGYLDPEYFQSSQFTEKSDVYSFGVVIVELLTGQKAISSARSQEGRSLATYFIQAMEENRVVEILDPRILKEEGEMREEMVGVARLAKRCLNLNGKKRPTMKEVAVELEGIRITNLGGGYAASQQNYSEEVQYITADLAEAWDVTSTSTGTFFDSGSASSFDIQILPLLLNKT